MRKPDPLLLTPSYVLYHHCSSTRMALALMKKVDMPLKKPYQILYLIKWVVLLYLQQCHTKGCPDYSTASDSKARILKIC